MAQKQIGFRLSDDDDTLNWIAAQKNLGTSFRLVMRMVMKQTGVVDFTDALADGVALGFVPEAYRQPTIVEKVVEVPQQKVESKIEVKAKPIVDELVDNRELDDIPFVRQQSAPVANSTVTEQPFDPLSILQADAAKAHQGKTTGLL